MLSGSTCAKAARKTLVNLTLGVTNVLLKSVKIKSNFLYLFALLGSALVKAGCKMLEKLTTGR